MTALALAGLLGAAISPPAASADERRGRQWYLSFLKAERVHDISRGDGVTVGVIDTGVDAGHQDLKENVLKGEDFTSTVGGDGWSRDADHGTAMASLIAGHGHGPRGQDGILGLAPKAKILPVRVSTDDPDDEGYSEEGITWAVDHGAKVINFSGVEYGLESAVEYALANDVVLVAGVGNTAQDHVGVGQPASLPGVIAVSGVGKDGRFTKTSTEGPQTALAAPAVDVVSAGAGGDPAYHVSTGTSNATALVSAAAALVRAKYPNLSAASVIERLIRTADDKGAKGRDSRYGFGVVNPLKALTADVPAVDKNPLGGPTAGASKSPSASAPASKSGGSAAKNGDSDSATVLVAGTAMGVGVMIVLGLVAFLAVRSRRRPQPQMPGWPSSPPPSGGSPTPPARPPSGWQPPPKRPPDSSR